MISGKVGKVDNNSCNSSKFLYKQEIFRVASTKEFKPAEFGKIIAISQAARFKI